MLYLPQWRVDRLNARDAAITALLLKLDACLEAFILNPAQSYTLNTGMTQQQVTRVNLPALRAWADDLRAEQDEILALLNSEGRSAYMRPGF